MDLTRFHKIAIQAAAHIAANRTSVGLSRVHMYESKCILPPRDSLLCSINTHVIYMYTMMMAEGDIGLYSIIIMPA